MDWLQWTRTGINPGEQSLIIIVLLTHPHGMISNFRTVGRFAIRRLAETSPCARYATTVVNIRNWRIPVCSQTLPIFSTTLRQYYFLSLCPFGVSWFSRTKRAWKFTLTDVLYSDFVSRVLETQTSADFVAVGFTQRYWRWGYQTGIRYIRDHVQNKSGHSEERTLYAHLEQILADMFQPDSSYIHGKYGKTDFP